MNREELERNPKDNQIINRNISLSCIDESDQYNFTPAPVTLAPAKLTSQRKLSATVLNIQW
jgi:hypothetical protein